MGNFFHGQIDSAISSGATAVSNLTIVNNSVEATSISTTSINLSGTTTNCMLVGNRIPHGDGALNIIGNTPSYLVYNTNIIGINVGLNDTRSIHASSGYTAKYSDANNTHWMIKDGNDYWEISDAANSATRYLYFPISSLPNGSKLNSVRVQGKLYGAVKGTLNAQLFKRSVNNATYAAISTVKNIIASSDFTNTTTVGKVSVSGLGEVINYEESAYYVQIAHDGTGISNPDNIRIYGVTVEFTY